MKIALGIILLVMSVFLVIAVLMQSGKSKKLSGTIAGGAETFFGKEKSRTIDAVLSKLTTVVAILFIITVIVVYVSFGTSNDLVLSDGTTIDTSGMTEEELIQFLIDNGYINENSEIVTPEISIETTDDAKTPEAEGTQTPEADDAQTPEAEGTQTPEADGAQEAEETPAE